MTALNRLNLISEIPSVSTVNAPGCRLSPTELCILTCSDKDSSLCSSGAAETRKSAAGHTPGCPHLALAALWTEAPEGPVVSCFAFNPFVALPEPAGPEVNVNEDC